MEMNEQQLKNFNATQGAWSVVTGREAGHDKSVTLDRHEVAVLRQAVDLETIKRMGGGEDDGKKPKHLFWISGPCDYYELALKYPKKGKTELRLYMSRAANFYAQEGDVFFIYVTRNAAIPSVGFMTKEEWEKL